MSAVAQPVVCLDDPRPTKTIKVFLTGQLILRYVLGENYCSILVPTVDNHVLKIEGYKVDPNGGPDQPIDLPPINSLTSDLWLDVPNVVGNRICFYMAGDVTAVEPSPANNFDIRWLADLERRLHKKSLNFANSLNTPCIKINAGQFYTSEISKPLILFKNDVKQTPDPFYVATTVGVNVQLPLSGLGTTPIANLKFSGSRDPLIQFFADKQYKLRISNNPSPDSAPPTESDFSNYYQVITGIPPCEEYSIGEPERPDNPDVPCMPGGGGFPPLGGG